MNAKARGRNLDRLKLVRASVFETLSIERGKGDVQPGIEMNYNSSDAPVITGTHSPWMRCLLLQSCLIGQIDLIIKVHEYSPRRRTKGPNCC